MKYPILLAFVFATSPALADVPTYELDASVTAIDSEGAETLMSSGVFVGIGGFQCNTNYTSTSTNTFFVGPQLICKARGTEAIFAMSARCDIRKPGDTDASSVYLVTDEKTSAMMGLFLTCRTTYSSAKKSAPAP